MKLLSWSPCGSGAVPILVTSGRALRDAIQCPLIHCLAIPGWRLSMGPPDSGSPRSGAAQCRHGPDGPGDIPSQSPGGVAARRRRHATGSASTHAGTASRRSSRAVRNVDRLLQPSRTRPRSAAVRADVDRDRPRVAAHPRRARPPVRPRRPQRTGSHCSQRPRQCRHDADPRSARGHAGPGRHRYRRDDHPDPASGRPVRRPDAVHRARAKHHLPLVHRSERAHDVRPGGPPDAQPGLRGSPPDRRGPRRQQVHAPPDSHASSASRAPSSPPCGPNTRSA